MNFPLDTVNRTAAPNLFKHSFDPQQGLSHRAAQGDRFTPGPQEEPQVDLAALARKLKASESPDEGRQQEKLSALQERVSPKGPSLLRTVLHTGAQFLNAAGVKGIVPGYGDGNW